VLLPFKGRTKVTFCERFRWLLGRFCGRTAVVMAAFRTEWNSWNLSRRICSNAFVPSLLWNVHKTLVAVRCRWPKN